MHNFVTSQKFRKVDEIDPVGVEEPDRLGPAKPSYFFVACPNNLWTEGFCSLSTTWVPTSEILFSLRPPQ